MALADILKISDNDPEPVIEVGAIVELINKYAVPYPLTIPAQYSKLTIPQLYAHAIVVSMAPFVLVSEQANMRWESSITADMFSPIGWCTEEALNLAMTRLSE